MVYVPNVSTKLGTFHSNCLGYDAGCSSARVQCIRDAQALNHLGNEQEKVGSHCQQENHVFLNDSP